ncbi:restriction endonuclease subunit S [Metapseudomonas otitidis]|uniref:restriction endonuclease subunit S n=1 Tax=Metapseudomonas otitidis TaxID=319939 RepID=UPI00244C1CBD|nr:restriction endonuclease subunit S [Pseudomonas otitidis]MDH0336462.1 restriction endonuclease subunit S [Pseudomonas otitidis]
MIALEGLMLRRGGTVDPSKFLDEKFELYSIPAFDAGEPELVFGKEIGSSKQIFQPGDVLLSKIVPHIRRSWVVGPERGRRIIGSSEWMVFRSDDFDPGYLRHVLLSDPFHRQFMQTVSGVGGSLLRAKPAQVAKIEIPFPEIAEQKRIAAILDKADALRAKRRKALEQLDALAQAIFIEMFGDPVQNPKEWPRIPLGELLINIESGKSPVCEDRPSKDGEWGVLKLGAVTKCEYLSSENKALPVDVQPDVRFEVKAGDLLFSRKNTYELVAACALVDETPPRMLLPDLIFRFCFPENSRLNSSYLHRLLITGSKRKEVQKLAGGAAGSMPNISKEKLRGLPIELPPLALQQEFAERVKKVELMKAEMRKSLRQLDALFSSLQHRAFRGEL